MSFIQTSDSVNKVNILSSDFNKINIVNNNNKKLIRKRIKNYTRSVYEKCDKCNTGGGVILFKYGNNLLCKRCKFEKNNKLQNILSNNNNKILNIKKKNCFICGIPSCPLRKGRCHACN
jgi:hypothetical protein